MVFISKYVVYGIKRKCGYRWWFHFDTYVSNFKFKLKSMIYTCIVRANFAWKREMHGRKWNVKCNEISAYACMIWYNFNNKTQEISRDQCLSHCYYHYHYHPNHHNWISIVVMMMMVIRKRKKKRRTTRRRRMLVVKRIRMMIMIMMVTIIVVLKLYRVMTSNIKNWQCWYVAVIPLQWKIPNWKSLVIFK